MFKYILRTLEEFAAPMSVTRVVSAFQKVSTKLEQAHLGQVLDEVEVG